MFVSRRLICHKKSIATSSTKFWFCEFNGSDKGLIFSSGRGLRMMIPYKYDKLCKLYIIFGVHLVVSRVNSVQTANLRRWTQGESK